MKEINIKYEYDERYNQLIYEINKRREQPDIERMILLIQENKLEITTPNSQGHCAAKSIITSPELNNLNKLRLLIASRADSQLTIKRLIEESINDFAGNQELLKLYMDHIHGTKQ